MFRRWVFLLVSIVVIFPLLARLQAAYHPRAACADDGVRQTSRPVITPANAAQVEQLAMLGRGRIEEVVCGPAGTEVAVATNLGVWR